MKLKRFEEIEIKDLDGNAVSFDEFLEKCRLAIKSGLKIYVGSDSQKFYSKVSMVTAVCCHHYKNGAIAFYAKQKVDIELFPTLKSRMQSELFCSLDAAFMIEEKLGVKPEVHIDIGSDSKKCKTFEFKKEFLNIIEGQGFKGEAKPNGWASSVADWFTKC